MNVSQDKIKSWVQFTLVIINLFGALAGPSLFHDLFSYKFQIRNFEFSILQTICVILFIIFFGLSLKQLLFWKEKEIRITQDSIQELNHFIIKEIFEVKRLNLEITVIPVNSPYWRLGIRFYKNKKLAKAEPIRREKDSKFVEIHIGAGDLKGNGRWNDPSNFYLTWYLLPDRPDGCVGYALYPPNTEVKFTMGNNGAMKFFNSLLQNGYNFEPLKVDLSEYKHCRILAWSVYNRYDLKVKIKRMRLKN